MIKSMNKILKNCEYEVKSSKMTSHPNKANDFASPLTMTKF